MRTDAHPQKALRFAPTRLTIKLLKLLTLLLSVQILAFPTLAQEVISVSSRLSVDPGTVLRRGDKAIFTLRADAPRNYYALAASPQDHGLNFQRTPLQLGAPIHLVALGELPGGQHEVILQVPLPLTFPEGTYYLQGVFADDLSFDSDVSLTNGISVEVRGTISDFETIIEVPQLSGGLAVNPRTHEAIMGAFLDAVIVDLITQKATEIDRVVGSLNVIDLAIDIELARAIFIGVSFLPNPGPFPTRDEIYVVDLNTKDYH